MEKTQTLATILAVITEIGGVANLAPDQDFYNAGLTSVQALPLLLELESRFEIAIPDDQFATARTAHSLNQVVLGLKEA